MGANSSFKSFDLSIVASQIQRVLVVEDASDLRQLNVDVLIDAGYQVDVADDGTTAWAAIQLTQYDLLITDQFLHTLSGVELVRKIHEASIPLPIIMVTETLPTWEFVLYPCLQAVTMLRKPYTMAKFLGMVKSVLAKTAPVGVGIAPSKWERELEAVGFPE